MRGTVIRVQTAAPAKLLTLLTREGIATGDAVRIKGGVRFVVRERYAAKTFAFLESLCYTYSVEAAGGRAAVRRALLRSGLIAGAAAVFVLYMLFGGCVWRIRIEGNERLSDKAVLEMLASSGVRRGVKGDFDFAAVERQMRAFDGISECSVDMRGSTLTVTVIEQAEIADPSVPPGRADIVSRYDATVTRVVCERGTARVKTGDVVTAGGTLIEGASYTTMGDDYGNPELLEEFRAQGEVYGAVVFSRSAAVPAVRTVYTRTGRSRTRTVLRLRGLSIGRNMSPYASYETAVTEDKLDFLPVLCRRITYYETQAETVETDPETEASAMLAALGDEAGLAGGTILSVSHNVSAANGMYYIHCYVTAEMALGEWIQSQ